MYFLNVLEMLNETVYKSSDEDTNCIHIICVFQIGLLNTMIVLITIDKYKLNGGNPLSISGEKVIKTKFSIVKSR